MTEVVKTGLEQCPQVATHSPSSEWPSSFHYLQAWTDSPITPMSSLLRQSQLLLPSCHTICLCSVWFYFSCLLIWLPQINCKPLQYHLGNLSGKRQSAKIIQLRASLWRDYSQKCGQSYRKTNQKWATNIGLFIPWGGMKSAGDKTERAVAEV